MTKQPYLAAIGNVYVETNFLGLETGGSATLLTDREYRAAGYEIRPGGSAVNFVIQALQFGIRVAIIGKTGDDENGVRLRAMLTARGISDKLLVSDKTVQTSIDSGLVFAHTGTNIQVVAGNANQKLTSKDINTDHPLFTEIGLVYLGGFLKQSGLYRDYPRLTDELRRKGLKIVLDHGRIPVDIKDEQRKKLQETLMNVDIYLPNRNELRDITGITDIVRALKKAVSMGPSVVAVKLDHEGAMSYEQNGSFNRAPGYPVKPVNVVGAGDVFNAGFVASLLQGKTVGEALRFGNAAAAVKISTNIQPDTVAVTAFIKTNKYR